MNDDRALEQRFLDRAKALSNVAEVFRCSEVTLLICEMVAFGVRAEAKIFEAAYDDPSGQKYWDAHLSADTSLHARPCAFGSRGRTSRTGGDGKDCDHSGFSRCS